MDAHRDGADVDPRAPAQAQKRAPAAVAKDRIRCVARVAIRAAAVRLAPEDTIRKRVRKVELTRVDDVARDVHLDVDVHRAAAVPAWVDGAEAREALRVGPLDAAHEGPAPGAGTEAGVDAARVRVPDVDRGSPDRPAGGSVDDEQPQDERGARPALGDVAAHPLVRDVVRTLGLLRRQDAGDGPGGDRGWTGAVGLRDSPAASSEQRGEEAAEAKE